MSNWISTIADLLSIIGFFITLWLLIVASNINKILAKRVRIPQLVSELDLLAEAILRKLKTWQVDKKTIGDELAGVRGRLIVLSEKLDGGERRLAKGIIKKLKLRRNLMFVFNSKIEMNEDLVWEIRGELLELVTRCKERDKDTTWTVPNA